MDSPDLQVKYSKLASEYSKLRAQNQVLKKAVLEEQSKNAHIKEKLKSQDQTLRKAEQEIDSLSFRNQQLTKRFSLLQDDLELIKSKPKKGQAKQDLPQQSNSIPDHSVYAEELESKIKENAALHAEVIELETFYKNKIVEYERQLEEASREAAKNSESVKSQEHLLQNEIKKLESERIVQDVHTQEREAKIISLQSQLKAFQDLELKTKSESSPVVPLRDEVVASRKPPETFPASIENKNVVPDGKVILSLCEPIKELSSGFVNFFSSYSSLLKNSTSMSSTQLKLTDQLTDERTVWELLSQRYDEMCAGVLEESSVKLQDLTGFDAFSKAFTNCASSLRKLLPVLSEKLVCFQEGQLDAPWRSTLGRLVSCWAAINPYLASLAAHSDGRATLTSCAVSKILNLLFERVTKLHLTTQELLTAWKLLNIEDRKQDEAIEASLARAENSLANISTVFSEKVVPALSNGSSVSTSPSSGLSHSPGTPRIAQHPGISLLGSPDASGWSGSATDGLQVAESEASLAQQLAQATSRLSKLEEEREHWRLEFQLLSHRFDKETKKCQQLEEQMKNQKKFPKELQRQSDSSSAVTSKSSSIRSSTSIIGEMVGASSSAEEREKEIRDHFTNRCSHLYMQLTACTSQAALYQNECETLIRRLALSEESRVMMEQEVEKQRRHAAQIQEALSTTSRNYEEQISTMSEHLADLTEKITSQADCIEQFKFELKKKGKK